MDILSGFLLRGWRQEIVYSLGDAKKKDRESGMDKKPSLLIETKMLLTEGSCEVDICQKDKKKTNAF